MTDIRIVSDPHASESLKHFVTDQLDMYNGSPERYDWKLLGKKEIYVPYNSYKLHSDSIRYTDILKKNGRTAGVLLKSESVRVSARSPIQELDSKTRLLLLLHA